MTAPTSYPKAVYANAASLGIEVDECDGFTCLDSPVGVVFVGNGEHTFSSIDDGSTPRAEMWGDLLEFLRLGLTACPEGDRCLGLGACPPEGT